MLPSTAARCGCVALRGVKSVVVASRAAASGVNGAARAPRTLAAGRKAHVRRRPFCSHAAPPRPSVQIIGKHGHILN